MINKLPKWLPTIVATVAILYLTLSPNPLPLPPDLSFSGADAIAHALMFGGFLAVLWFDVARYRFPHRMRLENGLAIAASTVVFGGVIEVLQEVMEIGRYGEILDFVANCIGVVIVWALFQWYFNAKLRNWLKKSA